jgi:hypothetical protein
MQQHAHVYIKRDGSEAVVATVHRNQDSILIEDDTAEVLAPPIDAERIGALTKKSLRRSAVVQRDLRSHKLTDWPAFRASGSPSVRRFEADFLALRISGANDVNLIFVITGSPEKDAELEVTTSISSGGDAGSLGHAILRVYQACRDRKL